MVLIFIYQSSTSLRYSGGNGSTVVREILFTSEKKYFNPDVKIYMALSSTIKCQQPIWDIELRNELCYLVTFIRFKYIFDNEICPFSEHRILAQMWRCKYRKYTDNQPNIQEWMFPWELNFLFVLVSLMQAIYAKMSNGGDFVLWEYLAGLVKEVWCNKK